MGGGPRPNRGSVFLNRPDLPGGQQGGGLRLGTGFQPGEGQGLLPGDRRIRSAEDVLCLRGQVFGDLHLALHRAAANAQFLGGVLSKGFCGLRHFVADLLVLIAAKGPALVGLDALRVEGFVDLLPAQKQLPELKRRQVAAHKVLVDLRQLSPQAL